MEKLVRKRGNIRQRATKLVNKYDEHTIAALSPAERLALVTKLGDVRRELCTVNEDIHMDDAFGEDELDAHLDEEEGYDDRIRLLLVLVENPPALTAGGNQSTNMHQEETATQSRSKVIVPQIPLPKFSNSEGENLKEFLLSFDSILGKRGLNQHQLYAFLRDQLSGGPQALIKSLKGENQTYLKAKALLEDAFDNVSNSKFDTIKRLKELKLKPGMDTYEFVGELRSVTTDITTHKIELDDVIQYFLWNSFDLKFQNHFTVITGKSRPSITEIQSNIFEACTRYNKDL